MLSMVYQILRKHDYAIETFIEIRKLVNQVVVLLMFLSINLYALNTFTREASQLNPGGSAYALFKISSWKDTLFLFFDCQYHLQKGGNKIPQATNGDFF